MGCRTPWSCWGEISGRYIGVWYGLTHYGMGERPQSYSLPHHNSVVAVVQFCGCLGCFVSLGTFWMCCWYLWGIDCCRLFVQLIVSWEDNSLLSGNSRCKTVIDLCLVCKGLIGGYCIMLCWNCFGNLLCQLCWDKGCIVEIWYRTDACWVVSSGHGRHTHTHTHIPH